MNWLNWIISNFGVVVFVIVVVQVVRAAVKAAKLSTQHEAETTESEEQRRVREIQERIRRKIAERRGEVAPAATMTPEAPEERTFLPPVLSRPTTAPLDPFGGPMRRLVTQLERRAHPEPPPEAQTMAVLARQEQLAEAMRVLEESRAATQRRVAEIVATQKDDRESATGVRTTARGELLADLRDTTSLRRAFVLREVLGAPVGLR